MAEKDPETKAIEERNSHLVDLLASQGWKIVRATLVERILELQNVAEYIDIIQTGNATKLLKEMKANKRAAEILFDVLRRIEGDAEAAAMDKKPKAAGAIWRAEED